MSCNLAKAKVNNFNINLFSNAICRQDHFKYRFNEMTPTKAVTAIADVKNMGTVGNQL